MGKCNWCGKYTESTSNINDVNLYMCSNKCQIDYLQAVEEGKISPPELSVFDKVRKFFLKLVLYIIVACLIIAGIGWVKDLIFGSKEHDNFYENINENESSYNSNLYSNNNTERKKSDNWKSIIKFDDKNGLIILLKINSPKKDEEYDFNLPRECEFMMLGQEPFTLDCKGIVLSDTLNIYFNDIKSGMYYGNDIDKEAPLLKITNKEDGRKSIIICQLHQYLDDTELSIISKEEYKEILNNHSEPNVINGED